MQPMATTLASTDWNIKAQTPKLGKKKKKDLTTPSYFPLNEFLQKAAVSLKALVTALNPTTSHPCPPLNQSSGYEGL